MAIKKCENCHEYYGKRKTKCPKCGAKNNNVEIDKAKVFAKVFAFIVVSILIIVGLAYLFPSSSDDENNYSSNDYSSSNENNYSSNTQKLLAYNYAEDYVKQNLKSPSSAKFPDTDNILNHTHYNSLSSDENVSASYEINSWVESKNSFGVMIKNNFSCEIIFTKDDKVGIKNLKIGDTKLGGSH